MKDELQSNVAVFKANLATCAVFLGKIDQAKSDRIRETLEELTVF